MMNQNIENELKKQKGNFVSLEWERPAKTRKGTEGIITKHSMAWNVRAGVAYDNTKAVQAKRESGELPKENAGLPYGEWIDFPYIIGFKGGRQYRFQTLKKENPDGTFSMLSKFRTEWKWNGKPVDFEVVKPYLLASEMPEKREIDCFNLKAENVIAINRVS